MNFLSIILPILGVLGIAVVIVKLTHKQEPSTVPPDLSAGSWIMSLPPNGRECFTPVPLLYGRVYRFTFSGTYSYWSRRPGRWLSADARNHEDADGNLRVRYEGLEIDHSTNLAGFVQDRPNNTYSCLVEGSSQKMALLLKNPTRDTVTGRVEVNIELLPEGTLSPRAEIEAAAAEEENRAAAEQEAQAAAAAAEVLAYRQAEERKHQEAQAKEREKARAKAAEHETALKARVLELKVMVHHNANLFDDAYLRRLVQLQQEDILGNKDKWMAEYEAISKDRELHQALEQNAPEVLDWFERRVELLRAAERLGVMPPEMALEFRPRPITSRTLVSVEESITRLFELRAEVELLREQELVSGYSVVGYKRMQGLLKVMDYLFDLLKLYGIKAVTPEEAEEEFCRICPHQPVFTLYESLMTRIASGETVGPEAIRARLEDLFREEVILQAKRRRMVRVHRETVRDAIDERLSTIRQENTQLRDFLRSIGCSVEFPDYRAREETREEQFFKLIAEKQKIIEILRTQGDEEGVEHVEALYAQEQARLFEADEGAYT